MRAGFGIGEGRGGDFEREEGRDGIFEGDGAFYGIGRVGCVEIYTGGIWSVEDMGGKVVSGNERHEVVITVYLDRKGKK